MEPTKEQYVIDTILHSDSHRVREDGKYPHRIGRICSVNAEIPIGLPTILWYADDLEGFGLITSPVKSVVRYGESRIEITTANSIYELTRIN